MDVAAAASRLALNTYGSRRLTGSYEMSSHSQCTRVHSHALFSRSSLIIPIMTMSITGAVGVLLKGACAVDMRAGQVQLFVFDIHPTNPS